MRMKRRWTRVRRVWSGMDVKLPSACDNMLVAHPAVATAAAMERALRQALANDALSELRAQLITSYAFSFKTR